MSVTHQQTTSPGHPSGDTGNVITAAPFQPSEITRSSYNFKAWHALLFLLTLSGIVFSWFLFTSKSVRISFSPAAEQVAISGGFSIELGGVWLLREGNYTLRAQAPLYQDLEMEVAIGNERNQLVELSLTPLPGTLIIDMQPPDATVMIDGVAQSSHAELSAGTHSVEITHPRYQPQTQDVEIEGRQIEQVLAVNLLPNWADIEISTTPPGAEVLIDDVPWPNRTPTTIEAMAGERLIALQLEGYKTHRQRVFAQAQDSWTLDPINLIQADAQVQVRSNPTGAGVIVNGSYAGKTPMLLDLKSGVDHRLQIVSAGYQTYRETLRIGRGERLSRTTTLKQLTGTVKVTVEPASAVVSINGTPQAPGQTTFNLPLRPHDFRIQLDGHAPYQQSVTPKNGLVQELRVRLLTHEEARLAALKPSITAPNGQSLKLFTPYGFTMGASRREPGRRANETLREVKLSRLFYLATHETTNAQFRQFASGHDSGKYVESTLNEDDQPAANLSWHDAAAFCNWLSAQEGLTPFYEIEFGKVKGSNPRAKGYRLPTEAEWSWAARTLDEQTPPLKFPWGDNLPPPDRHGNYADRAAANLVGRVIFGYNDNYSAAAPVGSYKPNHRGLFDMGGNVAEWMNDFYEIPQAEVLTDPQGPATGEYHVIKGASWMHGSVTELRYAFRDYGIDGRQDIGFRIARSAE